MKCDNLIGQRFGKLTVVSRGENNSAGKAMWICKCDCGNMKGKAVVGYDLKSGKVRSCGCVYKKSNQGKNVKHGMYHTRLYQIWFGIKERCKNHPRYQNFLVCEEWQTFECFAKWALEQGYNDTLTIDRIDNSKGYSPDNCRWATYKQQANNKTNNRRITINGETKTLSEWADFYGIPYATFRERVKKGWEESDLVIPVNLGNRWIRNNNQEERKENCNA